MSKESAVDYVTKNLKLHGSTKINDLTLEQFVRVQLAITQYQREYIRQNLFNRDVAIDENLLAKLTAEVNDMVSKKQPVDPHQIANLVTETQKKVLKNIQDLTKSK